MLQLSKNAIHTVSQLRIISMDYDFQYPHIAGNPAILE
jgi:hypothetical protein